MHINFRNNREEYNKEEKKQFERYLFDFYKGNVPDEDSFNNLLKYCGKIYPFISYLFFLKSAKKYLPIAPITFDALFKKLNISSIIWYNDKVW